jgi:hypothetical protein
VFEVEGTNGTLPDARGTYTVSGQDVSSNCPNPSENETVAISGVLTITSQTGADFGGSATLNETRNGNLDRIEVTFSGAINAAGQFSGAFTAMIFRNNVLEGSASGTFSGSLAGNVITVVVTPQVQECTTVVSLSGTR